MSDFEIKSKDEEVCPCYGLETYYMTKEDITALLSGKKLYSTVNCDEYAITIEMAGEQPFDAMQELPQYHFDRDVFVQSFKNVFSLLEIFDLEVACQEHRSLGDFHLYHADDEYYIIHLPSGTIINWYKHLGRTNTCNKEGFDLDDLEELLKALKRECSVMRVFAKN